MQHHGTNIDWLRATIRRFEFDPGEDWRNYPCVEWPFARSGKGDYGLVHVDGVTTRVHRACFEIINGPIPDGYWVLHKCDNPPCFFIGHLFLGTALDNSQDMYSKGRGNTGRPREDMRGEQHKFASLAWDQVREIRRLYPTLKSQRALAQHFGVTQPNITEIIQNRTWYDESYAPPDIAWRQTSNPGTLEMTIEKAREIRLLYAKGMRQSELCKRFGLGASYVCRLLKGTLWSES